MKHSVVLGIVVLAFAATGTLPRFGHDARASAPTKVAVSLEGLMALIHSPAFDRAAVVAVDATRATLRRDLPAHRPLLSIPLHAVRNAVPDEYADAGHTIGLWGIANMQVSFRTSAADRRIRSVRTADGVRYPRTAEDWRDVKWLIEMDRLVGLGLGRVKDEVLSADPRTTIVAARIGLEGGTLEATEPPEPWNQGETRFLALRGLTSERPAQQAVTQRILFTPDADDTIHIVLTPFGGGATRVIEIQAAGETTPVTISNHSTSPTLLNAHHDNPPQAVHFLAFYDLLATRASQPVIPSGLVPFPDVRTSATPGLFCPGDWPSFTGSFDR